MCVDVKKISTLISNYLEKYHHHVLGANPQDPSDVLQLFLKPKDIKSIPLLYLVLKIKEEKVS